MIRIREIRTTCLKPLGDHPKAWVCMGFILLTLLGLTGCDDRGRAEDYTRPKAAGRAMRELVELAEREKIKVHDFRGPYFRAILPSSSTLEFTYYYVYFVHPQYYYLYDDWGGDGSLFKKSEASSELIKNIKKLTGSE